MDDNKRLDFLCRVCLIKDDSSIMISLHDMKIREMFYECTSIAPQPGDSFPQQLCAKCWNRCRASFEFRTQALEAERQLCEDGQTNQDIAPTEIIVQPKMEPIDVVQEEVEMPRNDATDLFPADEDWEPDEEEDDDEDEMETFSHADSLNDDDDPLSAAAGTTRTSTGTTPNVVQERLLPIKSSSSYQRTYKSFLSWLKKHGLKVTEESVGSYFQDMAERRTPNSLWTVFSMLKVQILSNHGIDINQMNSIKDAIRKKNIGYVPKKSKSLTADDVHRYLKDAPMDHLINKVVVILGVFGAMSTKDIYNLSLDDVRDGPNSVSVTKTDKKSKSSRTFSITGSMAIIIRRYLKARMLVPGIKSFLIIYRNGTCIKQPVGINSISLIPSKVAKFMGLADAPSYTGMGLKKASADILRNIGSNFTRIQRIEDCIVEGESSAQGDSQSCILNDR